MTDDLPDSAPSDRRLLVSVLLVAHRQKDLIADALESVLAQDYSSLEIIASDNCSPADPST
ncbi:glycosyltransferase [Caballeronia sp. GAWG1-5s-s]|uniref:glycosyltransferase n=1 Tax=Caballeronia sp. GAWG1-5s-s TaxID=2921743 RepID=UPI00202787F8|nr:glycosyltransferase [Caballeronia sp. GAWG1-5s-s]